MKRGWLVVGWLCALAGSALPALWVTARRIELNPLGKFVDMATGEWTAQVYWYFLGWWLPVAIAASALAGACMFVNWPPGRS